LSGCFHHRFYLIFIDSVIILQITGRTHQLRVHLAAVLDYPVVHDDLYINNLGDDVDDRSNNSSETGNVGKDDHCHDDDSDNFLCHSSKSVTLHSRCSDSGCNHVSISSPTEARASSKTVRDASSNSPAGLCAALCVYCQHGPVEAFSSEQLRSHGICLHALRLDVHRRSSSCISSSSSSSSLVSSATVPGAAPASAHLLPLLTEACGAFPPPLPIGGADANATASPCSGFKHKDAQDLTMNDDRDVIVALSVPTPSWASS